MIGQHFNPEPINKLILILLLSLFTTQSDIYIPEHFTGCGYSYLAEHQNYDHTMRLLDKQAAQFVSSKKALYTLPVVCHIIHNNGSENISDDEVIAAIEDLNEAFENIGYYDPTTGVNADIEFCLALRTPDENASNGIIRTESTLTDFAYDIDDINLKNLSRWDPNHHINIWIVKEIRTTHSGSGVAGYATLPASHGRAIDGIVVESRFLNQSKSETTVLVHEMGHYLGLYHTFQGGCINSDCSTSGDHVCDTPPDNSTSRVPCDAPANSCNSDVNSGFSSDQNDMINNYMDYSALECYNAFTEGQRNRMHYFIENIRQSLLDSKACQSPCLNPIGIGPVQSSFETVTGAAFQINPDITGANDYSWMIDGTLHSTNNIFEHVFNAPGDYLIELIVENGDPNCDQILSFEVDVDCDIEFEIISDATYLEVGDVANFSHQTQNEDDIYWYINDQPYSIANAISYSFINEGYYEICLEASNTYCSETKCVAIIVSDNAPQCNDSKLVQYETNGPWINAMESIGDQVIGGGSIEGCSALLFFDESLNIEESFTLSDCNGWLVNYLTYDELDHIYIGCNNVDNESILIIKYQLSSRTIIWQRSIHHTERINYRARILLYGNSVFLQGQMDGVIHGCDALLIELNAEDGMMLNDIVYHLGSCETFSASIISNNSIISAGRFNNAGGGQSKFRFAVATMNLNADIQWCNLYTVGLEGNARTYATHILDTGNSLVLAGFGDYHGTGVNDIDLIFQEIDYDGDIVRHHSYTTNQGNTYRPRAFTILPNGYLLFGDFIDASGIDRSFILSISKLGVPLSFRVIERSVATHLSTAEIVGGQILISGYHENDDKGFIAKLLLPLDEADNSCILSDELYTVNTIDRPHISTPVSLSEANPALTTIITPKNFSNVSIQTEGACTYSCLEICGNGMDDNLDGLIDCEDPIFRDSCCCLPVPWLDLGQDTLVCENAAVELLADPGFVSYKWNTGETERIITAAFDGLYQVEAVDSCGNQVIDSIRVGYFENTILELGQDTFTCENSVEISSNLQFTNYQWYVNNSNYGCPGCPSLIVNEQAGDYEIICVASNQNGCISVDTIQLRINEKIEYDINLGEDIVSCDDLIQLNAGYNNIQWSDGTSGSDLNVTASGIYIAQLIDTICAVTYADTIIIELLDDISMDTIFNICSGESVMFYGEEYDVAGDYTQAVPGLMMCDTMYFIEVQLDASNRVDESYYICQGDSIYINQEWIYEERYLEFRKSNTEGCDSLFFISIEMLNHSYSSLAYKLCEGESVEVNQLVYDNEGVYTQNFNNDVGCDSLLEIDITFNSPTESYVETVICEGARYSFNGIRYDEAGSYEQILLNHAGCDSLVYITIDVEDIYIPNIFSPTLPGNNEFKAYTNCQFDSYALSVYDRWGNLVFHSSDPDEAWNGIKDGKLLEQGVYMYAIEYSTQNVSKQNSIFGSITLIL